MYITMRSIDYIPGLSGVALTASTPDHLVRHSTAYIGIQDFSALGVFHVMRYINERYLLTYLYNRVITESAL